MQDQLVNNNIKPEERIPTEPVVSHPQNMNKNNDSMKTQINGLINDRTNLNSKTKDKLMNLLKSKSTINQIDSNNNYSNLNQLYCLSNSYSNLFNINTLVSR